MSTKGKIIIIILSGILLLAVGTTSQQSKDALASSVDQDNIPNQETIAYTGRLTDANGQSVTEGVYTFAFTLYDSETGGQELWSEVQESVMVKGGIFNTPLGSTTPLPTTVLNGRDLWLSTGVRGSGETEFATLAPRQRVSANASASQASVTAGASCSHDHVGEVWTANMAWSSAGLRINNSANGPSLWGWNTGGGNGVRGDGWGSGIGVYGEGVDGPGVVGVSANGYGVEAVSNSGSGGVWAHSSNGYGLFAQSVNLYGVFAHSDNTHSIYVDGSGADGLHVESAAHYGITVSSAGYSGIDVESAFLHGIQVDSANNDGVHVFTAGVNYYGSGLKGAEDFAVLNTGEVRSKVGFATPAKDYAVMMNVQGVKSDYEPGDVLVISGDQGQRVDRCTTSNVTTVLGVYSPAPGFLGGQTVTGQAENAGSIPVAIMGIASVKVSAENGSINPGDLLVTSSTPGYAMRGTDPTPGTILGKALGSLEKGTGTILVLLTLR